VSERVQRRLSSSEAPPFAFSLAARRPIIGKKGRRVAKKEQTSVGNNWAVEKKEEEERFGSKMAK